MLTNTSQNTVLDGLDPRFAEMLQQEVDLGVKALQQNNPDMAATFFQSALRKVPDDFPFYDHIVHNLLLSYKQRAEQLLLSERNSDAVALLPKVLTLDITGEMADNKEFRRGFADAIYGLGLIFFQNREFSASLKCCRRAIELNPNATYHVNLINNLAVLKQPALLSDFTTDITSRELGKHVFIACVPKSASTFLKNVLVGLSGYADVFSVYSPWQNEQEIYLPSVLEYAAKNTVTQQHCRGSEANLQIMQAFGIRPVILVRNIYDSVISLLDFYNQGAFLNTYFRGSFMDLDEERKIDLLIDNVVPWYLQFVASWQLIEKEDRLEMYWLKYEDMIDNKVTSISQLLEFYGLGTAPAALKRLIESEEANTRKNRFNKGVAGRGKATLTELQRQRISHFAEYYPNTDFSCIGL